MLATNKTYAPAQAVHAWLGQLVWFAPAPLYQPLRGIAGAFVLLLREALAAVD
jgi:hypothetical protein